MKTTVCAADSGGVNFSVFFRGCCNCLLTTTRQLHKNAEKFVACCVRAAQLAKLATCFTACHEFMHTAPFFSPAQHLTELVSIAHFSNASWKFWFFLLFFLYLFYLFRLEQSQKANQLTTKATCLGFASIRNDFFLCRGSDYNLLVKWRGRMWRGEVCRQLITMQSPIIRFQFVHSFCLAFNALLMALKMFPVFTMPN